MVWISCDEGGYFWLGTSVFRFESERAGYGQRVAAFTRFSDPLHSLPTHHVSRVAENVIG